LKSFFWHFNSSIFAHKGHSEIDIEFAQWNDENIYNGNYTVWYASEQPQEVDKNNTFSFPIDIGEDTFHSFEWNYDKIVFSSNGSEKSYPSDDFIYQENYSSIDWGAGKDYIPISNEEYKEKVHINLYWFQGPPTEEIDIEEIEVIIKSFHFTAIVPEPTSSSGSVHNLTKDTYYDTIQAALDDADSNNTIEVSDGTYDEKIIFPPYKKVTLQSVNGAYSTTIRGDDDYATVNAYKTLEGTTIEGFTITHADGLTGSGITLNYGNMSINNCIISGNTGGFTGGGILNYYGNSLTITGSTISGNTAGYNGGGIFNIFNSSDNSLTITGSTISGNAAGYHGGGIFIPSNPGTISIGGDSADEKNTLCGNYKSGYNPSLDQQIGTAAISGSLYETYKDTNYISAYCEWN